mgnify:CR=1 FL=1
MRAGTCFENDGERYVISIYGPKTCLCWLMESDDVTLWRFETVEIERILNAA